MVAQPNWASASFINKPNLGTAFPNGTRGGQKFLVVALVGASSGCVHARVNGFLALASLKLQVLESEQPPHSASPHSALQQHGQPRGELAHSSHVHRAKPAGLLANTASALCSGVVFSYCWEKLFFMGAKLLIYGAGIRWAGSCGGASSGTGSGHQAAMLGSDPLFCAKPRTCCYTATSEWK